MWTSKLLPLARRVMLPSSDIASLPTKGRPKGRLPLPRATSYSGQTIGPSPVAEKKIFLADFCQANSVESRLLGEAPSHLTTGTGRLMWGFFRIPFRNRHRFPPQPHLRGPYRTMSSASGAAAVAIYASAVSKVTEVQKQLDDDAERKTHHAPRGRGFINPWESFLDRTVLQIAGPMLM
jgi:hypothetical protein